MKWVLVVLVMGSAPVKTDLVFSSLSECLEAEMTMRSEYAAAYNRWIARAQKNQKESGYPCNDRTTQERLGLHNRATCIPHP